MIIVCEAPARNTVKTKSEIYCTNVRVYSPLS
jgi:hypothetical protein